jgi:hypothetical protein
MGQFPEFMEKLLLLRERLCVIFPEAENTEQLRENLEKALTAA